MKRIFTFFAVLFLSYGAFALSPISGTTHTCVGSSSRLSEDTIYTGGTWSSSNTGVATVGLTTGVVTGITIGASTITYFLGGSFVTVTFTVSGAISGITGASSVCAGVSTVLTDATSGGTWSCDSTGVAAIDALTGVLTGVSAGGATVIYTVSGACSVSAHMTVMITGIDTIHGPGSVCSGSTITLTDATTGGAWSSSNTAVATVSSGGVVTGVSAGTVNIDYTATGVCGAGTVVCTIAVSTTSSAGVIYGSAGIPIGGTDYLSDGVPGGHWTSSNTSIATVDDSSGTVTGIAIGAATITYTVSGCSGTVYTTFGVTVSSFDGISGQVWFPGGYSGSMTIYLITYNPGTLDLEAMDSINTYAGGDSVYYQFTGLPTDSFRIKAAITNDTLTGTGFVPTYHNSSSFWHDATVLHHTAGSSDMNQDIHMGTGTIVTGPGFVGGNVMAGANRGTSGSIPATGLLVFVVDPASGAIVRQTTTDESGNYSFSHLPLGTFNIYPELINYATTPYNVTLTPSLSNLTATNFIQHTVSRSIAPGTTGGGVIKSAGSSVMAFPNPTTTGILTIQWQSAATENGDVTVTDITGRHVYKTTINMAQGAGSSQIDLSALSNGLYMISVRAGDINYNNKIEIER